MAELHQRRSLSGLARFALAALAVLLPAATSHAQEADAGLYERPVLVLDPGVHTAPIMRADVDAAGRLAVTGSYDRTVRVWSLEDGRLAAHHPPAAGTGQRRQGLRRGDQPRRRADRRRRLDPHLRRRPAGAGLPLRRRDRRDDRPDRRAAERRQPPRLLARRAAIQREFSRSRKPSSPVPGSLRSPVGTSPSPDRPPG